MNEKDVVNYFRPGLWRHYKGGLYSVISLVTHHESREPWVLYVSLNYGGLNVRPLHSEPGEPDGFLDPLKDGTPRFSYVGVLPSDEPAAERGLDSALRMFAAETESDAHFVIAKNPADAVDLLAQWWNHAGFEPHYAKQLADTAWVWRELKPDRLLILELGGVTERRRVGDWIQKHGRGHLSPLESG